jgi:hypothetical protein
VLRDSTANERSKHNDEYSSAMGRRAARRRSNPRRHIPSAYSQIVTDPELRCLAAPYPLVLRISPALGTRSLVQVDGMHTDPTAHGRSEAEQHTPSSCYRLQFVVRRVLRLSGAALWVTRALLARSESSRWCQSDRSTPRVGGMLRCRRRRARDRRVASDSDARIKPGDVITRIDDVAVRSAQGLRLTLSRSDTTIPVTLVRQRQTRTILLRR